MITIRIMDTLHKGPTGEEYIFFFGELPDNGILIKPVVNVKIL